MAYHLIQLVARLSLLFLAGEAIEGDAVLQPHRHHDPRRTLARTELEFRHLGRGAWRGARGDAFVAASAGDKKELRRRALRSHLPYLPVRRLRLDLLSRPGFSNGLGDFRPPRLPDLGAGQR